MADYSLTHTRMLEGIWEGVIRSSEPKDGLPALRVTHLDVPLEGVEIVGIAGEDQAWALRITIPVAILAEGVQTIVIGAAETGETLNSFAIAVGTPVDDDFRAEIELLRAELDMLKRAFRRHCVETT